MSTSYRVVPGPLFSRAHLARAQRYERIDSAVAAMGDGVVVTDDGTRIAAFHEKHLLIIERLAARVSTTQQ